MGIPLKQPYAENVSRFWFCMSQRRFRTLPKMEPFVELVNHRCFDHP